MTIYKFLLVLEVQPEGGYTVTCPLLPELITEGASVREALHNIEHALAAAIEAFEDLDQPSPSVQEELMHVYANKTSRLSTTADIEKSSTLGELLESEFFGMWSDRTDISDSSGLARQLREQAWQRGPQ